MKDVDTRDLVSDFLGTRNRDSSQFLVVLQNNRMIKIKRFGKAYEAGGQLWVTIHATVGEMKGFFGTRTVPEPIAMSIPVSSIMALLECEPDLEEKSE